MSVKGFLFGVSLPLTLTTIIIMSANIPWVWGNDYPEDYDDYVDPNWMVDYDPWNNPPCPDWNPRDGCGRTPARTKPPVTTPKPDGRPTHGPGGPATREPNSYKLVCTEDEIKKTACLHGGNVWPMISLEAGVPTAILSADKVEKAGIAAGVVAVIIIVVTVIVYLIIKRRKERKERAEANGQAANGHAGKALIADKDKGTTIEYEDEKCTDV